MQLEMKICNSDIIRRIALNMPGLEEYRINVTLFLEACKHLGSFLGYFGMALRSVQYMIIANEELISKWREEKEWDLNDDLTEVLIKEFDKDGIEMNQAIYQLMKCINFCSKVLCVLGRIDEGNDLARQIDEVYTAALEPYQNTLPNWMFHIMVKSCPSKTEILCRLITENDTSEDIIREDIIRLSQVLSHVVEIINEHFRCRWNIPAHY